MKKLIVALIGVLMLVTPLMAADQDTVWLEDIRTSVRYLLGGASASQWYSDEMINDFINMACREYASIAAVGIGAVDTIITGDSLTDYPLSGDFIAVTGVVKTQDGRKVTMHSRDMDVASPAELGIGEDNADITSHVAYYVIYSAPDTDSVTSWAYYIRLDPVMIEGDTVLVHYKRQAVKLTEDSTRTNIPYVGINFIKWSAYRNCLLANKEAPGVQMAMPLADRSYAEAKTAIMNKYAPLYDPNWKPTQ